MAILNFKELLHLFMTNKGICTKIVYRHIIKGKPRAARFAVSTDVRFKTPEYGIWVVLILLFYTIDTAPTIVNPRAVRDFYAH